MKSTARQSKTLLHEVPISNPAPLYGKEELATLKDYAKQKGAILTDCIGFMEKSTVNAKKQYIVTRIDVDESLPKADHLAEILDSLKIPATFFFRLHTNHYNFESKKDHQVLRKIMGMGFEIGLHSENLFLAHDYNLDPDEILREDLKQLAYFTGTKIPGSACHGEPWYYKNGINNLDFWKTRKPQNFGLIYEAYDRETLKLFYDSIYISDSPATHWKAYDNAVLLEGDQRVPLEHLKTTDRNLYLLIHPDSCR